MKKLFSVITLSALVGFSSVQAQDIVTLECDAGAWMRSDDPDNFGDSTFLLVGQFIPDGLTELHYFRTVLRFDLSDPSLVGKTVSDVSLNIYRRFSSGSDEGEFTISAYELYPDFISLKDNSQGSQVTWNNYTEADAWNTPGADGIGTDRGDLVLATTVPFNEGTAGEVTAPGPQIKFNNTQDFIDLVNANIGGSVSVILILDGEGELLNASNQPGRFLVGLGGHNDATVAQRPTLTLEFGDAVVKGPGVFSDYDVVDGYVNTGDWMGWVYVEEYPYVYVSVLDKYIYAGGDSWFYVAK